MRIPRLLLVPLLASACAAPMAGQSNSGRVRPQTQTTPNLDRRIPEFQLPLPRAGHSQPDDARIERFQPPASLPMTVATQQSATCYFIQTFHFARVTPGSDAVKLTGVSTCQPAPDFEMRDVNGRP
jgi:hypothetical protein